MSSIPTESTPYTVAYVSRLLSTDEAKVLALCTHLGIEPRPDQKSGNLMLDINDVNALRKALDAEKGEGMSITGSNVAVSTSQQGAARSGSVLTGKNAYVTASSQRTGNMTRTDLSVIVEAVSNVKEGILRDLSLLLDDKLSGLDEVVVELIRSKSENDSLREELKRLEESRTQLESELSKFKPAAFGFYRKES